MRLEIHLRSDGPVLYYVDLDGSYGDPPDLGKLPTGIPVFVVDGRSS